MESTQTQKPTQEEIDDESRRMRRLRILVYLALDMFPGKERAFDLLYRPKFQRVMHEIYRLQ